MIFPTRHLLVVLLIPSALALATDFGSQQVGTTSAEQTIAYVSATATIVDFSFPGSFSAGKSTTCSRGYQSSTCVFTAVFTPGSVGTVSGNLKTVIEAVPFNNTQSFTLSGTGTAAPSSAGGDGGGAVSYGGSGSKADLNLFRPSAGRWFIALSANHYSDDPAKTLNIPWGSSIDTPLVADVDGDGKADLILYRPSAGRWFIALSTNHYSDDPAKTLNIPWGSSIDTPLVADVDGDGKADLILYRPSAGRWFIALSTNHYSDDPAKTLNIPWGSSIDTPLVADVDGDGKADLILYRPSAGRWFIALSTNHYSDDPAKTLNIPWGSSIDTPLVADVDSDGKADLILYRPSAGRWFIAQSTNHYSDDPAKTLNIPWGSSIDTPLVADVDGDGKADLILYRPSAGRWFIAQSTNHYSDDPAKTLNIPWGSSIDTPLVR